MDAITVHDLETLARPCGAPCVSIFMPTQPFGPDSQITDSRRLKNLLKTAEGELSARGLRAPEIDALLAPGRALIDDRPFWLRSENGLAIFLGSDRPRTFQVPEAFAQRVVVSERFYVKPLLKILGTERPYWVLALSQKRVRLLHGTRSHLVEVDVEGIPESLAEALRWDDFEKQSLQFHTQTSAARARRPAVFHGTGETDAKDELVRYFRQIDRGLHELLRTEEAPLVLAGVDYLFPIFRDVSSYEHLADEAITGSPESMSDTELHARSREIVEAIRARRLQEDVDRVAEAWTSPRVTSDAKAVIAAAHQGRVDTLFAARGFEVQGVYDPATATVTLHARHEPGDDDLLDRAAVQTLLAGGTVHSIPAKEMPHGADIAALLRY